MNNCQKYLETLIDGSYQQMTDADKKKFEKNLDPACRKAFDKMKLTLHISAQQQVPDPGKEYWDRYWNNLQEKLEGPGTDDKRRVLWSALIRIAAILFAGIFIGYLIFSSPDITDEIADEKKADFQLAALNEKTATVLEDSKILLLGIVNLDAPGSNAESIDFSFQKKISHDLLVQTADLKSQLRKTKNRRVVSLLNELEMILMQIANLEDDFDIQAIEMVKEGAENQSLLFKINMERLLMEAKEEHNKEKKIKKEL